MGIPFLYFLYCNFTVLSLCLENLPLCYNCSIVTCYTGLERRSNRLYHIARCVAGCTTEVCVTALSDVHTTARVPNDTFLKQYPCHEAVHDCTSLPSIPFLPAFISSKWLFLSIWGKQPGVKLPFYKKSLVRALAFSPWTMRGIHEDEQQHHYLKRNTINILQNIFWNAVSLGFCYKNLL